MKNVNKTTGQQSAGRLRSGGLVVQLSSVRAFTLIEIMIVVAIMGMILAAGIPSLYHLFHKEGFRKTLADVVEVCDAARRDAILHDKVSEVVFHPQDGTFEGGGRSGKIENAAIWMLDVNLLEYKDAETARIRFFPNGTSDEMTLILESDKGEWCKLALEITTGMVMPPEYDRNKWLR